MLICGSNALVNIIFLMDVPKKSLILYSKKTFLNSFLLFWLFRDQSFNSNGYDAGQNHCFWRMSKLQDVQTYLS